MLINCREFNQQSLRVYNTYPYLIRSVDVYFLCDDANISRLLLTPQNGQAAFSIFIDGNEYPISYGYNGESTFNPITYRKTIQQSKLLFTDSNEYNTDKVTAIGGSSDSPLGAEWIVGTNINAADSILIELNFNIDTIDIINSSSAVIVIEVSQKDTYDYLYRSLLISGTWDGKDLGYGMSSYGGILDGGNEGYGGVVI